MAMNPNLDDEDDVEDSADDAGAPLAPPPSEDDDTSDDDAKPVNPAVAAYLAKIQAAQDQVKKNNEATGLTSALVQLGHGLSRAGGSADLSGVEAIAKNNDAPLTNLQGQIQGSQSALALQKAQAGQDPNSPEAQALRKLYQPMLAKIGLDPSNLEGLGPDDIKSYVQNPVEFSEKQQVLQSNKELQAQTSRQNHELAMAQTDKKVQAAQDKADEKIGVDLQGKLDSSGARAGNFGKAGNMIMAADRIKAILDQYPDGNIPKAQTEELATAQAALVGGGSVQSQNQLNAIVPQSIWGDANAFTGWLTNNPKGLGQQEFIKNLADSAKRERDTAQAQVDAIKAQRLGAYNDFANRNPKKFSQIIKAAGMDPKQYDFDTGEYTPATRAPQSQAAGSQVGPAAAHLQDSQAVQWAKANPNDPRAAKILQLNGAQ